MSGNSFSTGSWIGGTFIQNPPAAVAETTSNNTSSMDNFMGALMGGMLSGSGNYPIVASSYDTSSFANAITAMNTTPSEAKLNIPQGQQAKGISCNAYKTVSRSNYGQMWS
jgi:hypothetical protein